jgi:hypothetical protein
MFTTQTVDVPIRLADLDEERETVLMYDGEMEVLVDQRRPAGGLPGRETLAAVSAPDTPPFVRYTWQFLGAPYSSTEPAVSLVTTAPAASRNELETAWNELLNSLAPFPPAPE